ncbi:siderophore-interacting protein [Vibrio sp. SCSIO 43136]|uniref:siderophore-interacting protein n=1 Tax=Vibrio sp. SCSIO 43136 TaxID=2819101 RepID=UPI002075426D|nr:siderophore-interacting protein [Vibrio sp. SCSIO 43136]USD67534.1 siderophore-interacting protein [Vibrio sp. SCSIO 43136]
MTIKNALKNIIKAGVMKMSPSKAPKLLTVISKENLSENYIRLTLSFEKHDQFPPDCAGQYVKLLFTPQGSTDLSQLSEGERSMMRTYTIRSFDSTNKQLTIDFVKHTHDSQEVGSGLAGQWAATANVGDTINVAGPGPRKPINTKVETVIYAADMTAIPALAAALEDLTPDAKGHAFIQVTSASDIQPLSAPKGIQIEWVVSEPASEDLSQAIEKLPKQNGSAAIWCAAEFSQMRTIRRYFSQQWDISRDASYFSSYWKLGVTEDGHKVLKSQDAKEFSN